MKLYSTFRDGIQFGIYRIINPAVIGMIKIGITPNVVTTMGLVGQICAAAVMVYASYNDPGNYMLITWSGLILILSSIFDMVDGYMARTGNMCTTFGAFYDSVLDRYSELLTLGSIAFYLLNIGMGWAALVTFISLIGSIMVSYVRARAEGLGVDCKVGLMQRPERVVVTCLGMLFTGWCAPLFSNPHDALWILIVPQIVIAVLANYTAAVRINHVRKSLAAPNPQAPSPVIGKGSNE